MNLIYKYYGSILGLIRFLGIGVGNEDARASSVFTITISALSAILLKLIGFNIRNICTFFLVLFVLGTFFIVYYSFSNQKSKLKINNWLSDSSRKKKLITGIISLILLISLIIILFKIYG